VVDVERIPARGARTGSETETRNAMKIPEHIKSIGLVWEVKQNKEISREGNCYGSTHHTTQNIYLDPELPDQKKEQTFVHELLHIAWDGSSLSRNKKFESADEEMIVDALANMMYHIFKDNDLLK
jgi:hypothetical protein